MWIPCDEAAENFKTYAKGRSRDGIAGNRARQPPRSMTSDVSIWLPANVRRTSSGPKEHLVGVERQPWEHQQMRTLLLPEVGWPGLQSRVNTSGGAL